MTTIPTREEIQNQLITNIQTEFSITIPNDGRNFLRAFYGVLAAVLKMWYLLLGSVQKNALPDTADPEEKGGTLDRFGRVRLGRGRFPATQGIYTATVTGTATSVIPAGTTFLSDSTSLSPGYLYILDNAYTMPGTTGTITVRALTAGQVSLLQVGDTATITEPVAGINSTITIASVTTAPRSAETIEDFRNKILESYRLETQGGSRGDYRLWGYDAQGVRQIYPYASSGNNNEVDVYVEATIADSEPGTIGEPGAAILSDVADVIETSPDTTLSLAERSRRPLGVFDVNVYPVVIKTVNITIATFADSTPEKVAAILAAMTEAIYNVRPFCAGIDVLADRNDIFDTSRIGAIILSAVPGSSFGAITLTVGGAGVPSYTFDNGEIPNLGTITYI